MCNFFYGQWLICLIINVSVVLYVLFGSEINIIIIIINIRKIFEPSGLSVVEVVQDSGRFLSV